MLNGSCSLSPNQPSWPCKTDDGSYIYARGSMPDVARDIISRRTELRAVLNMGVAPERIVLASAVKCPWDISFALKHNVNLMTFDSVEELSKVKDKNARLLLRIKTDETGSHHTFNNKFGCSNNDTKRVLQEARVMGCNVVGVSFHVGCAYEDPEIFHRTIEKAKAVFDLAATMGIRMTVLDIGGGLPGGLRKA
ncbi:hypothetical protein MTO96_048964 [Rhipicephalus appendiculatus]